MTTTPNADRALSVRRLDAGDVAALRVLLAELAGMITDPMLSGRVAGMLDRLDEEDTADDAR